MSGKPVVVISPKGIEYKALKDLNMNIDDILEMIRQCNYYSFDQVLYGIIETNGKMSVIPTCQSSPVTAKDLKIENPNAELPHIVISDGKILKDEMITANLNKKKLNAILNLLKIEDINKILILSIDNNGKVYYQLIGEQYKIIENIYKETEL